METIAFSKCAYESADLYLNYVRKNEKSREIINIISISEYENQLFHLKISKKLYQLDSVYFSFNSPLINNGTKEDEEKYRKKIRIIEYDESEPSVTINVDDDFYETFSKLKSNEMVLVSDLSFLIEATKKWYHSYGDKISFPSEPKCSERNFIVANNASPEQISAIETVLKSPISYIWGAPGTGKTQIVLSSCISSVADSLNSVLVVGPTNNAVEQSLRGIIKMFKDIGININSILRLGKASREFSTLYPDLCEKGSIAKEVSDLKNEVSIVRKKIYEYDLSLKVIPVKEELISLYNENNETKKLKNNIIENILFHSNEKSDLEQRISKIQSEIKSLEKQKANYVRYTSIVHTYQLFLPIYKLYSEANTQLLELQKSYDKNNNTISLLSEECRNIKSKNQAIQSKINTLKSKTNSFFFKLKGFFAGNDYEKLTNEIQELEKQFGSNNDSLNQKSSEINIIFKENENLLLKINPLKNNITEKIKEIGILTSDIDIKYSNPQEFKSFCDNYFKENKSVDYDKEVTEKELTNLNQSLISLSKAYKDNSDKIIALKNESNSVEKKHEGIIKKIKNIVADNISTEFDFGNDLGERLVMRLLSMEINKSSYENLKCKLIEKEKMLNSLNDILDKTYNSKQIFACTVDYLILHYEDFADLIQDKLRYVFLDEAAYCSMIKSAPLFSFGVPVAMFGDHMQLPPICEMENKNVKDRESDLSFLWSQSALYFPDVFSYKIDLNSLRNTYYNGDNPLFCNVKKAILSTTYRFGENLANILDKFVYHTEFHGMKTDTRIIVIDAPRYAEEKELRENHSEALAIKAYVEKHPSNNFAILTPYKKQRDLLYKTLPNRRQYIYTIHSSQGREWDTVILSVVDTQKMFFTDSKNKFSKGVKIINTAISRAKKELVIICDKNFWQAHNNDQLIGNLVSNCSTLELAR